MSDTTTTTTTTTQETEKLTPVPLPGTVPPSTPILDPDKPTKQIA